MIRILALEKIRIQPQEVKVYKGNPFKYDLLERQEAIETLTRLISSIKGPCVMAVDAPWGGGKTTFLNIWSRYLHNQGFSIVEFNAWKEDFSKDPFVALCAEFTGSINTEESP